MIFYSTLSFLLLPIYIILLIYRLIIGKEDTRRIRERFGIATKLRSNKEVIWFHVASIGESFVAATLVEEIYKIYNNRFDFLITSGTVTSAKLIERSNLPCTVHQFLPIDNPLFINNFLKHWKPIIGIFIESELWPVTLACAKKRCKLILVNARLSDKSFNRWKKFSGLFKLVISNFSETLVQSQPDLEKFQTLGAKRVLNLGNIKFANKPLEYNKSEYDRLFDILKSKNVVFFASTHKEDEEKILQVIKPLKNIFPDSYFILAPRHPDRGLEILNNCKKLGLSCALRTQRGLGLEDDLYIVNTFKELGLFYRISHIAYVGGAFAQGGHNPLEPAHFDNIIFFGPLMSNFREIAQNMVLGNAAIQIKDSDDLKHRLEFFLSDQNKHDMLKIKQAAKNFVLDKNKILNNYIKIIKGYIY